MHVNEMGVLWSKAKCFAHLSDGIVLRVNEDDLKILVGRVLQDKFSHKDSIMHFSIRRVAPNANVSLGIRHASCLNSTSKDFNSACESSNVLAATHGKKACFQRICRRLTIPD